MCSSSAGQPVVVEPLVYFAGLGRSGSTELFGGAHAIAAQVDDDEKLQLMLGTSTTRHYYSNFV